MLLGQNDSKKNELKRKINNTNDINRLICCGPRWRRCKIQLHCVKWNRLYSTIWKRSTIVWL